jgi:hypothetical protein
MMVLCPCRPVRRPGSPEQLVDPRRLAAFGRTTLNALSGAIPGEERTVTIEDAAEPRLRQRHVVRLEARPANLEGRGEVTIRQLVKNAPQVMRGASAGQANGRNQVWELYRRGGSLESPAEGRLAERIALLGREGPP